MSRRGRRITRRKATRSPAARIVVVTEGALTEPQYLRAFREVHGNRSVRLITIGGVGDPRAVVERAIAELDKMRGDKLAANDSVWAMFDRDVHPQYAEAKDMAHGNRVRLAISNPCFEVWGIFHYRDHHAFLDRHECQRRLAELCAGYSRTGSKVFNDRAVIENGYHDAVGRAENSLVRRREDGAPEGNPSTTVHRLTEHIRRHR